ncbi:hypothetical protein JVU11DRAFT_10248 [Chiua virens]|nr:hypothetical protein JVU11DRAFT_10248 [Chiua virens]
MNDMFACLVSLATSAIHSALSEHTHGKYEPIEFSCAKTKEVYKRLLNSLSTEPVLCNQLYLLKGAITQHGLSLIH